MCTLVAVLSFVLMVAIGQLIAGTIVLFFYYLGGVGVRERSRYAATIVFCMYFMDILIAPSVFRVLTAALLFSNLRATWMAARWKPDSEEAFTTFSPLASCCWCFSAWR